MLQAEHSPRTRLLSSDQGTAEFRAGYLVGEQGLYASDCAYPGTSPARIRWLRGLVHRIRCGAAPTASWTYNAWLAAVPAP